MKRFGHSLPLAPSPWMGHPMMPMAMAPGGGGGTGTSGEEIGVLQYMYDGVGGGWGYSNIQRRPPTSSHSHASAVRVVLELHSSHVRVL